MASALLAIARAGEVLAAQGLAEFQAVRGQGWIAARTVWGSGPPDQPKAASRVNGGAGWPPCVQPR